MPEWMRSQFMAPAYALLISLAVALVLGLSMNKAAEQGNQPEANTPATDPASIRVAVQNKDEPQKPTWDTPDELVGTPVTIQRADSSEQVEVGEGGAIPRTIFDQPVLVCLPNLPGKWEGVNVAQGSTPRKPCWTVDPKAGSTNLEVRRGG